MLLSGGDLAIGADGDFAVVTGSKKLTQDLRCALLEPLGNDRFHLGFGSSLEDFVAQVADETTGFAVREEVRRVISNYSLVQQDQITTDVVSGGDSRFTTDQVITQIDGVAARITDQTVKVSIGVTTAAGQSVVVNEVI